MATRIIKDAKDLSTGELIYFKGHAKATYTSDGISVEAALNEKASKAYVDEKVANVDIPDEIYIGDTEPTDEKVKVWINPNEEANTIQARTTSGGGTSGGQIPIVWLQGLIGEQPTESQLADNVRAYNALMNRDAYSVEALVMMHDVGTAWGVERYLVGGVICISEAQVVQIELFTSISEEEYKVMPFYLYPNGSISLEAIEQ